METPDIQAQLEAATARVDASESVAAKLTEQLAALATERDSLFAQVAALKAAEVSAERRAAIILSECRIPALPLGNGGPVRHAKGEASKADAIAELEAASKESPEAFAACYARVGSVITGG